MPSNYPNPGNLRRAPWLFSPVIENNFWKPVSRAQGIAGAAHVVSLHIAEGDTLRQLISGKPGYGGWAPVTDGNKTEQYIQNVKTWAEIPDENVPLWNFIEPATVS